MTMSEEKHTPGPWHLTKDHSVPEAGLFLSRRVADAHGHIIAHPCGTHEAPGDLPFEANAHLIAAAPELLEACKAAHAVAENAVRNLTEYDKDPGLGTRQEAFMLRVLGDRLKALDRTVQAAIAKAEGK